MQKVYILSFTYSLYLIVILLSFTFIAFCENDLSPNYNYLDYEAVIDWRDAQNLTYMELESRISKGLLTPPYANGTQLLKDLDEYIARLGRILDAFEANKQHYKIFAKKEMDIIGKAGPKVYLLTWNEKHLLKVYKWEKSYLNKITARLKHIECIWDAVRIYMKCIYDDSIPLTELNERIIKAMNDPQKGKGDDLLSDAYNYYNILDDIEKLIKDKNSEGEDRLKKLIKEGGPTFINATMADDYMRYLFKWEPTDFNELRATIDGTKIMWKRLLKRLNDIQLKRGDKQKSEDEKNKSD